MAGKKPSIAVCGDDVVALLAELDACQHSGEIGAVLRREEVYSSSVAKWRRQRRDGVLESIKRGPGQVRR